MEFCREWGYTCLENWSYLSSPNSVRWWMKSWKKSVQRWIDVHIRQWKTCWKATSNTTHTQSSYSKEFILNTSSKCSTLPTTQSVHWFFFCNTYESDELNVTIWLVAWTLQSSYALHHPNRSCRWIGSSFPISCMSQSGSAFSCWTTRFSSRLQIENCNKWYRRQFLVQCRNIGN